MMLRLTPTDKHLAKEMWIGEYIYKSEQYLLLHPSITLKEKN